MSNLGQHANKVSGPENASAYVLEQRLGGTGVQVDRCAPVEEGTKACYNHDDQQRPTEVSGNYTVHGGDGVVLLDIDVPLDDLPDWVTDLPSTFVVESPHGGYHLYYVVKDDAGVSNRDGVAWGSIRYGEYVVGPGSVIDHSRCDNDKDNCPGDGAGRYEVVVDKPIATLSGEHLKNLRKVCNSGRDESKEGEEYGGQKLDLPDEALADEGERYICTEFPRHSTELAMEDLMDFLRGGTGSYDLHRNGGSGIDQSAADYYALEGLYGAFRFRNASEQEARQLTIAVYKRYCRENPYDKTGHLRKWLRKGEAYLQEQMDAVVRKFDFGQWHRWRRREYEDGFDAAEQLPWTDPEKDGIPSQTVVDTVRAALWIQTEGVPPRIAAEQYGLDFSQSPPFCGEMFTPPEAGVQHGQYPVASDVGELAEELNPEREASTFEETLKKLQQKDAGVAMAFCPSRPNRERFVYYPKDLSDPSDARWVKEGGEKRDPEPADSEQQLITDGGTPMSDTKHHDEPEQPSPLATCPVCGQPFTSEGIVRNHVSQTKDDEHRGLMLDESMSPVKKYKREDELRKQYLEKDKTQNELAEEWGCGRNTIHRWLVKFDIPRPEPGSGPAPNRVERASFTTEPARYDGYEKLGSYNPETGRMDWVAVHQLVAISDGADPAKVFSGGEFQCHHRNAIPWDNRAENIELLPGGDHQRTHRVDEWTEKDGIPVLVTQEPEFDMSDWGPGSSTVYDDPEENPLGPGPRL